MNHVWGCDVGTRHVAIAIPEGRTWTVHIGAEEGARRLSVAYKAIKQFAFYLAKDHPPLCIFVERPTGKHPNPSLSDMAGVVQAALYDGLVDLYSYPVTVYTIPVGTWKKQACGSGRATKEEVMTWARGQGFEPQSQDEADAVAIATAGALMTATQEVA